MTHTHPARSHVAIALAALYIIWGSTYLGIHLALEGGMPPLSVISGTRFVVAGGVLYALLRWRGVPAPTRAQWPTLAVMGPVSDTHLTLPTIPLV